MSIRQTRMQRARILKEQSGKRERNYVAPLQKISTRPTGQDLLKVRKALRRLQVSGIAFFDAEGVEINLLTAKLSREEWVKIAQQLKNEKNSQIVLDFVPRIG